MKNPNAHISQTAIGTMAIWICLSIFSALLIYTGLSNNSQDEWLAKYDRAILQLVEAGEYSLALETGEKSLIEARTNFGESHYLCAKAHVRISEAYRAKGDIEQCIRHLRAAIAIYDTHEDIRLVNIGLLEQLGDLHVEIGDIQGAETAYTVLLVEMKKGYFRKTAITRIEQKIQTLMTQEVKNDEHV